MYPKHGAYQAISAAEKKALTQAIGRQTGAEWKRMERFSRWGQGLETAVYTIQGAEFVFVPGDAVTLGWNGFPSELDEAAQSLKSALMEDVQEYWCGELTLEEMLAALTTPARQVEIPPMLVERRPRPVEDGQPVPLEELERDERVRSSLEAFRRNPRSRQLVMDMFELGHPKLRFSKERDGTISAEIVTPMTVEDLQARLAGEGFTLPDADQWEYLCSGGSQALFAWGNSLRFCGGKGWKQQPNFFGLTIAFDPYKQEIVWDSGCWYRGGDGGAMECYGSLRILNDFVCSPHFCGSWDQNALEDLRLEGLSRDYDCYRRVLVLPETEESSSIFM